jgi:hypothetical protein
MDVAGPFHALSPSPPATIRGMGKEPTKQNGGTVAIAIAGVFAVLPALYVLSIGPVYWLAMTGYIDPGFSGRLYSPIIQLCEEGSALYPLLRSYLDLWAPD